jgi:hypothetical protein
MASKPWTWNHPKWPRKLSDAQVAEIRARFEAGAAARDLAGDFGVSAGYVWMLTNPRGRTRRHPTG